MLVLSGCNLVKGNIDVIQDCKDRAGAKITLPNYEGQTSTKTCVWLNSKWKNTRKNLCKNAGVKNPCEGELKHVI